MKPKISVSVVYAEKHQQWIEEFEIDRGSTVKEALDASGLLHLVQALKGKSADDLSLGLYAQSVKPDDLMQNGDRLEIYRPLTADPKEVRRQLAALGKTMGSKNSK